MKTPRKLAAALMAGAFLLAGCTSGDDDATPPAEAANQAQENAAEASQDTSPPLIDGRPSDAVCDEVEELLAQVDNDWGAALALQYREMLSDSPSSFDSEETVTRLVKSRDTTIEECFPDEGKQWWSGDIRDRIDDTVSGLVEHNLLYGSGHFFAIGYIAHEDFSPFTDQEKQEAGFSIGQSEIDRFMSMDDPQDVHQAAVDFTRMQYGEQYLFHPWIQGVQYPPSDKITETGEVCGHSFSAGPPSADEIDPKINTYIAENWEQLYEESCNLTVEL